MVKSMDDVAEEIAKLSFDSGFVKVNFKDLITWPNGVKEPIYVDNGKWNYYPEKKRILVDGFMRLMRKANIPDEGVVVVGAPTSGISPGTSLADRCGYPFAHVEDSLEISGLPYDNFKGQRVLLVEEVIASGRNSIRAVQAIRDKKGEVHHCFVIFDYGFEHTRDRFAGKREFNDEGARLLPSCEVFSLYDFDTLLRVGKNGSYIKDDERAFLDEWRRAYSI